MFKKTFYKNNIKYYFVKYNKIVKIIIFFLNENKYFDIHFVFQFYYSSFR